MTPQYQALGYEQIAEATHARLANGEVENVYGHESATHVNLNGLTLFVEHWQRLGITPLKAVPPQPMEFVGEALGCAYGVAIVCDNDALGKKFRCTQIVDVQS